MFNYKILLNDALVPPDEFNAKLAYATFIPSTGVKILISKFVLCTTTVFKKRNLASFLILLNPTLFDTLYPPQLFILLMPMHMQTQPKLLCCVKKYNCLCWKLRWNPKFFFEKSWFSKRKESINKIVKISKSLIRKTQAVPPTSSSSTPNPDGVIKCFVPKNKQAKKHRPKMEQNNHTIAHYLIQPYYQTPKT